jgi:hypothetical protein
MQLRIESLTGASARRKLLPKLRGRVFHITNPERFIQIAKSGAILANSRDRFVRNWEYESYFASLNCVSVCDFLNNGPRLAREASLKSYNIFGQRWGATTVFLFLAPSLHKDLITWERWEEERSRLKVVPYLESGYPKAVSLRDVDELWWVTIKDYSNFSSVSQAGYKDLP